VEFENLHLFARHHEPKTWAMMQAVLDANRLYVEAQLHFTRRIGGDFDLDDGSGSFGHRPAVLRREAPRQRRTLKFPVEKQFDRQGMADAQIFMANRRK